MDAEMLAVVVDRALETEGSAEGFSVKPGPGKALTLEYGWGRDEATVVDPENAEEVGADWLRDNPVEEE